MEEHWQYLCHDFHVRRGALQLSAISGIEIALWDIKGRALGVPVYELLRGKTRERIWTYERWDGATPEAAVEAALQIQRDLAGAEVRVRIGLHTGEAIRDRDDFFGLHVNLAARVGSAATGGEILVSALLKELAAHAGEFRFDDGREVELKGIGPQRVHRVEWQSVQ